MRSTATLVRVLAFTVFAGLCTLAVGMTFVNPHPRGIGYAGLFTDSSGLEVGSDVRMAGITVGQVTDVEVRPDNQVLIGFQLREDVVPRRDSRLRIRYKNLIGDRYLEVGPGIHDARPLPPGGVLPAGQTRPALSLDELFNGFAPLFEGLRPDQINQLSGSIIATFQGEGGSVDRLLDQVGSLTGTLADRDRVLTNLIDNLNGVLGTLDEHGEQLDETVSRLTTLVDGLAADRARIGRSVSGINDLAGSLARLLRETRPGLRDTVHHLGRVADQVNRDSAEVDELLRKVPGYHQVLGRLGAYSSAFQFFLCGAQLRTTTPAGQVITGPMVTSEEQRCHF